MSGYTSAPDDVEAFDFDFTSTQLDVAEIAALRNIQKSEEQCTSLAPTQVNSADDLKPTIKPEDRSASTVGSSTTAVSSQSSGGDSTGADTTLCADIDDETAAEENIDEETECENFFGPTAAKKISRESSQYSQALEDPTYMLKYNFPEDDEGPAMDIDSPPSDDESKEAEQPPHKLLLKRKACEEAGAGSIKKARVGTNGESFTTKEAPKPEVSVHEGTYVIANEEHFCHYLQKTPFGVQYEIARLISIRKLTWSEVPMEEIDRNLVGTNQQCAPITAGVILTDKSKKDTDTEIRFAEEVKAKDPWEELDREEMYLKQNPFAGLGFHLDDNGNPIDWHGGKVQLRGKILKEDGEQIKVELERAELGPSCHLMRRFGSKNFLRLKVAKKLWHQPRNGLFEFCRQRFILLGYVYRAFRAHDQNIILVRTNEPVDEGRSCRNKEGLDFMGFLNFFNPIDMNCGQSMAKWASRYALGLSDSVPGIQIRPADIQFIDDEESDPPGSDMTDGCGFISRYALQILHRAYQWESFPTAIQCRIAGSKGLLIPHPTDIEPVARVWLRKSQIKIKCMSPLDPSFLIIDVLRSSHCRTPACLNYEVMINLFENKVPLNAFRTLIRDSLAQRIDPLLAWDGDDAMPKLWDTVAKCGSVFYGRRQRMCASDSRVKGYGDYVDDPDEDDDDELLEEFDSATHEKSVAWCPDYTSGCPSSLEETVMYLIDSGFDMKHLPALRAKHEPVVEKAIKAGSKKYRVDMPMSLTAFMVPDPTGELAEGEIFFKCSEQRLLMPDGTLTDILLGNVLVTRSPCKLPTDVQKWTAVDKLSLRHVTNVVVFPIKGKRRPADYLGGGDYDGDKALVMWAPVLVEPFQNAPLHFADEPASVKAAFSQHVKPVSEFLEETSGMGDSEKARQKQEYLLAALKHSSEVGQYNNYLINAMYKHGYTHPEVTRLAYMFCIILDGAKTGMTVLPKVQVQDARQYGRYLPPSWKEYMETEKDSDGSRESKSYKKRNKIHIQRNPGLKPFVMDRVRDAIQKEAAVQMGLKEKAFDAFSKRKQVDPHLTAPWLQCEERARMFQEKQGTDWLIRSMNKIRIHVEDVYQKHSAELKAQSLYSPSKRKAGFTGQSIESRQDVLRKWSKKFASGPDPAECCMAADELAKLKASYAYLYDSQQQGYKKGWSRFPWNVAMRDLCEIKAKTLGNSKTITTRFYESMTLKRSML